MSDGNFLILFRGLARLLQQNYVDKEKEDFKRRFGLD